MKKKQLYQKPHIWLGLSFLTGAAVMVAAIGLFSSGSSAAVPTAGVAKFVQPTSRPSAAANYSPAAASGATQVVISQPLAGDSFASADAVTVAAQASNPQGIKNMVILIDGQLVKTCLSSQCAITVPAASLPGSPSHTVQVLATGLDGTSASGESNFSVQY